MASSPTVRSLTGVVGSRITRVRRVHYLYRGVPDTDFGPLELTFGGQVVLFDNAADGETAIIWSRRPISRVMRLGDVSANQKW